MERIKGPLQPNHHAAIRLKIEGKAPADIAVALGVKERSVHLWFSDDQIKAELQRQVEKINEVFVQRMAEVGMVGVHELLALARIPTGAEVLTAEMKLEVVREILDRLPQTARVGVNKGGGGGTQVFTGPVAVANMTDEQLLKRAKELAAGVPVLEEGISGTADEPEPEDPD
jgi:hypothetical protein